MIPYVHICENTERLFLSFMYAYSFALLEGTRDVALSISSNEQAQ